MAKSLRDWAIYMGGWEDPAWLELDAALLELGELSPDDILEDTHHADS